jgi:hypothetical protein
VQPVDVLDKEDLVLTAGFEAGESVIRIVATGFSRM